MKINIIGMAYSGQALDIALLRSRLEELGHHVNVESVEPLSLLQRCLMKAGLHRIRKTKFDLNIFIQQPREWWVPLARKSVVIPNPDWLHHSDMKTMGRMDAIWCKTVHAMNLFTRLGYPSYYLGFTSPLIKRQYENIDKKYQGCLHVAGSSELKGTLSLIDEWKKNPQWPVLTVLSQIKNHVSAVVGVDNIKLISQKISVEELSILRTCNVVHIQMSETEGYGHVLSESMGCGAVVVTLDAKPMNELINHRNGFLVKARMVGVHYMAERFVPDSSDFQSVMESIFKSSTDFLIKKSLTAMQDFEVNKASFEANLEGLLAELH